MNEWGRKMTNAQQFCEEIATVADSLEASNKVAAKFSFKKVVFKKHDNKRGLRFADGSKVFFGDEGKLILPVMVKS